jgi:hypothetical protein
VPAANLGRVSPQDACEVCGRTFLVGEKVHSYVSVEGRHEVCDLCVDRVAAVGWLPAAQDGAEERMRAEAERKPGFLSKLFARPEEEDEVDEAPREPAPPAPRRPEIHELETERYDVEGEWSEDDPVEEEKSPPKRRRLGSLFGSAPSGVPADLPAPDPVPEPPAPLPDPAGRGMRPRRLQPDLSPANRFERAIARFNGSDAGRTAAGLTRTLGAPSVSVGDHAGAEDVVRVTVAWELTWYQWGVDLSDELRPVFELEKGFEVSEIDAAARQWNASAHDGRIVMVAPKRREAENGRPVHR